MAKKKKSLRTQWNARERRLNPPSNRYTRAADRLHLIEDREKALEHLRRLAEAGPLTPAQVAQREQLLDL